MSAWLHFKIFVAVLFSMLFAGCTHPKHTTSTDTINVQEQAKIAFFVFTASKDSLSNVLDVTLKDKIITEGKLKPQQENTANSFPDCLKLVFSNGTTVLKEIYVEHPLYRRMDVFSENGTIESKSLHLPSSDFSLRMSWINNANKLLIYEYINYKKTNNVVKIAF